LCHYIFYNPTFKTFLQGKMIFFVFYKSFNVVFLHKTLRLMFSHA